MASLLAKIFDFQANIPVPSLDPLDAEFQQVIDVLNGTSTGTKLLVKTSDASDPVIECDQIGAGPLAEWKQNGVLKASLTNDGSLTANGITGAAGVYTFGNIPVGPASNPSSDNQLARKAYVDTRKTHWSASWFIDDPSTYPLGSFDRAQKLAIPDTGGTFTATAIRVICNTGSNSGSFIVTVRKHVFSDQSTETDIGSVNVNPALGSSVGAGQVAPVNHTFSNGDWAYVLLTGRSLPLQRNVTISLLGHQTLTA